MRINEASLLVLGSLSSGPLHGYGIVKEVERLSDGQTRLTTGGLYALMDRLAEAGLIARAADQVVDGRNRRNFELTQAGREATMVESRRMAAISATVQRLVDPKHGAT